MPDLFGEDRRDIDRKRWADDAFVEFWQRYPRKVNRVDAVRAWMKLRPTPELVRKMLDALDWQCELWDDPAYIPHASTWINKRRWEDERPEPKKSMGNAAATVFRVLGGKAS